MVQESNLYMLAALVAFSAFGVSIVNLILLGYFFFGCYLVQLPGVYIKKITAWVPIFRIIGAVTVILVALLLIHFFGIIGAAYAIIFA